MEVQHKEMERQREHFQVIVESLGENIQELRKKKEGPGQDAMETRRAIPDLHSPELEKEASQPPRDETPMSSVIDRSAKNLGNPQSYATVAASKPVQIPEQPWTKVSYGNQKSGTTKSSPTKKEECGRRILFPRKKESEQRSEADLMLALNKALQKAGVRSKTRFCHICYAPSGSISAFLTEQADASMLLP